MGSVNRLAQYGFDAAVRSLREEERCVAADFPRLGCLYLRPPGKEAELEGIRISFQDGQEVMLHPVLLNVQKYEFEEINQKNLLFLAPFRMFVHEKEIQRQQDGNGEYGVLFEEIQQMNALLGRKIDDNKASVYDAEVLNDVALMVMRGLGAKYPAISREVEEIMGGNIVATPRYDRLVRMVEEGRKEGRKEGFEQGREEGHEEFQLETMYRLFSKNKETEEVAFLLDIPVKTVSEHKRIYAENKQEINEKYGLKGPKSVSK